MQPIRTSSGGSAYAQQGSVALTIVLFSIHFVSTLHRLVSPPTPHLCPRGHRHQLEPPGTNKFGRRAHEPLPPPSRNSYAHK